MDELDTIITKKHWKDNKRKQVAALQGRLREELPASQFQMILAWEAALNERLTDERESWYLRGVSDGLALSIDMPDLEDSLLHE